MVPPSVRTAVPNSPFGFRVGCAAFAGTDRSLTFRELAKAVYSQHLDRISPPQ